MWKIDRRNWIEFGKVIYFFCRYRGLQGLIAPDSTQDSSSGIYDRLFDWLHLFAEGILYPIDLFRAWKRRIRQATGIKWLEFNDDVDFTNRIVKDVPSEYGR